MENTLYYGENLKVLREHVQSESVDLIYLDPPFNSNRSYNVLFKDESGISSDAQITAFDDSWHWGDTAQQSYEELLTKAPDNVASMINSLHQFIGANQMMAYLVMMAVRLLELHRVLKPTGSLYLHCDPTSSHYLKIVLDAIFGIQNFKTEISWRRSSAHSDAKQGRRQYGNVRDTVFYYTKSNEYIWNLLFTPYEKSYINKNYRHIEESTGRIFRLDNLTAAKPGGDVSYEFMGTKPYKGRYWAYSKENLQKFFEQGRIYFPKNGGTPAYIRYLDEMPGVPLQNNWDDILPATGNEYLGFPTQKPLALLERIIQTSSNPGDVVLDPFSGCGTCISASQKLDRKWIGIDITHLAIAMHKARLKDMFNLEPKRDYQVIGEPGDLSGAQQLASEDRYQFQWWALSLIEARPLGGVGDSKTGKKGSDRGIDGVINFLDDRKLGLKRAIVQVKSGHVNSGMIRDLKGTLEREQAAVGIFITLESSTREMDTESVTAGSYHSEIWNRDYPRIQILTIEQLLNGAEVKLPQTPNNATIFRQAEQVDKEGPKQAKLDI
jgi:site-specific DNA-methyltransferase (adenine-specific)